MLAQHTRLRSSCSGSEGWEPAGQTKEAGRWYARSVAVDKRLKLVSLDEEDREPLRYLLDPKAAKAIQISFSPSVSEIAFIYPTSDDDLLPELTHKISLSPNSEDTYLPNGFS